MFYGARATHSFVSSVPATSATLTSMATPWPSPSLQREGGGKGVD